MAAAAAAQAPTDVIEILDDDGPAGASAIDLTRDSYPLGKRRRRDDGSAARVKAQPPPAPATLPITDPLMLMTCPICFHPYKEPPAHPASSPGGSSSNSSSSSSSAKGGSSAGAAPLGGAAGAAAGARAGAGAAAAAGGGGDAAPSGPGAQLVSTFCGHLAHKSCADAWFTASSSAITSSAAAATASKCFVCNQKLQTMGSSHAKYHPIFLA